MRVFYFIAKKISYTFSLAFLTVFGGWLGAAFAYFLGTSFILSSYETIIRIFITWLPWAVLVPTILHYIYFGMLQPFRIPAWSKSLRHINANVYGDVLRDDIDDNNLKILYKYFSDLPLHNAITAAFGAMIAGICLVGFVYYDFALTGEIQLDEIKILIRSIAIGLFVALILYTISTYILTEIITNNERALCYNELRRRNIDQYPRVLLSLRFKLSFFIILLIISLLTFAALMQKSIFYYESSVIEIIVYLLVSVFAGFFLMVLNTNTILRILKDISRAAGEMVSGKSSDFKLHSLDRESAEIEYSILKMSQEIEEYRANLESKVEERTEELQNVLSDLKEKDDMIQKQLDMASIIQRSILPGQIEDWNELKFSVRYIAMEKIGGDYYDVYYLKNDKLGVLVADVSGHGIPAALVTTMAKMSFGNACQMYDSPRRIFQEVNQNILDYVKTQNYLTTFFVAFDSDYNVIYSNASHQKALLIRTEEGKIERLDTNGLFIGAIEDARDSYEEKQTKLNYGDRIVLYTDGIPESLNINREEYSNTRFEENIMKNRQLPLEDFTSSIIEDVQRFIGNATVQDDITLMVVELARDETVEIIKKANELIENKNFYEAIDHLERGLSLYPNNRKLLYNVAKNYFRVNDYKKTIEHIEKYLKTDRKNKYAFYVGGSALYMLLDYASAIDYFEHSLRIDPNFVNALFALGMVYKKTGQREEAIKNFEKVVNIDPENKVAWYELNQMREET